MIKLFCDNCQTEIKDFTFTFEATIRQINKVSSLVAGNVQQRPQLEEKKIHLCKPCHDKKFK